MGDPIDALARAMFAEDWAAFDAIPERLRNLYHYQARELHRLKAREALASLREPTQETLERAVGDSMSAQANALDGWHAVIDVMTGNEGEQAMSGTVCGACDYDQEQETERLPDFIRDIQIRNLVAIGGNVEWAEREINKPEFIERTEKMVADIFQKWIKEADVAKDHES